MIPKRRKSLTLSVVKNVTLVVTLGWLISCALAVYVMQDETGEAFDTSLQQTAHRLLPLAVDFLFQRGSNDNLVELPQHALTDEAEFVAYQVIDKNGRVLLRSHEAAGIPFSAPLKTGFSQDKHYRYYTESSVTDTLFLQLAEPLHHRHEALRESAYAVLLPIVILIPISMIGIWWSVRRGLRPVIQLQEDISSRDSGNLMPINRPELPRELAPIVGAINNLMVRLKAALSAERSFTANSAHELRTPIAAALAQTQRLLDELDKDNPALPRARQIESTINRLKRLAEKLLQLSRAEAGVAVVGDMQDLTPAMMLVLEDFERDSHSRDRIEIERRPDQEPLRGKIDIDAFAICLRNIVENALVHGDPSEPVKIRIDDAHAIHVSNGGPVIPAAQLAKLTDRFERNNISTKGSGLGLAIVETIVRQAGGELTLLSPRSNAKDGFEVILRLPGDTP